MHVHHLDGLTYDCHCAITRVGIWKVSKRVHNFTRFYAPAATLAGNEIASVIRRHRFWQKAVAFRVAIQVLHPPLGEGVGITSWGHRTQPQPVIQGHFDGQQMLPRH